MNHIKSRKHAAGRARAGAAMVTTSLATSLALALPAFAADAADEAAPEGQLPTVHVEGHRIDEYKADEVASPKFVKPLVDTTQSIQIITGDLIQSQGATTLTEALRNSAGVGTFYVGENGNTTTGDAIYMRGFDSSSSIFVDGARDLGSISRDVFNIEQIEVTKGPAGTDNGRTAPTGAVNLVTKHARSEDFTTASLSFGSAGQKRVTADWNTRLGAREGAAFRLNVMAQDSGVPGRDHVENDRWGIAPSIAFGLGTDTRFTFDYLHVKQSNVPDGGVFTIGLPGYGSPDPVSRPQIGDAPRVDRDNFYGTDADHDDVTVDMATLQVEHDFSEDFHLENTTRWGRNEQDYLLTAFMGGTSNFVTPDLSDPSTWTITRNLPTFKNQTYRILTNHTNLRMHWSSGRFENDLSTGLELTREKLENVGKGALNGTAWPAANVYHPDPHVSGLEYGPTGARSTGKTDTAAVYLFDTVTFNEHWQANAGVRIDRYETDFSSLVACGGRGPACGDLPNGTIVPGVDADTSDTLFNWKVGVLYKPTANGSVYANYEISQQPPGGAALELSSSANSANNPIFDPQEAKTAEIGTKWNVLGDRLLLTAALYRTRVTNEIVQDPVDQQYYQTGEKRVQGVELGAVGQITENWSVSANYTKMDADVREGSNLAQDGSTAITYTPDSAFSAWTTYRAPAGFTFGFGARYNGEMKRGRDGAVGTPPYIESYWVFDGMLGYTLNEHLDLRLNAYNLFDKEYVAAINKSGYRYTPGGPRSFLLTANVRF